jgi:hypothetical protein
MVNILNKSENIVFLLHEESLVHFLVIDRRSILIMQKK